jgi:hypothetical protein
MKILLGVIYGALIGVAIAGLVCVFNLGSGGAEGSARAFNEAMAPTAALFISVMGLFLGGFIGGICGVVRSVCASHQVPARSTVDHSRVEP